MIITFKIQKYFDNFNITSKREPESFQELLAISQKFIHGQLEKSVTKVATTLFEFVKIEMII